jgi:hypothetical protein
MTANAPFAVSPEVHLVFRKFSSGQCEWRAASGRKPNAGFPTFAACRPHSLLDRNYSAAAGPPHTVNLNCSVIPGEFSRGER